MEWYPNPPYRCHRLMDINMVQIVECSYGIPCSRVWYCFMGQYDTIVPIQNSKKDRIPSKILFYDAATAIDRPRAEARP